MTREDVINVLKRSDAVCFDVDSTICTGEGIDELAEFCGKGAQVREITLRAMGGSMEFRDALDLRLGAIKPTQDQLARLIRDQPLKITPGAKDLINLLKSIGKKPYLISGGFDCLIHPAADELGIAREDVFANRLKFFNDGSYAGFDETRPTSKSGGKGRVIAQLKEKMGYSRIVMIGDGATDMEACPPADAFIGFGGNVVREAVRNKSDWFVTDFQEIINVLKQ